MPKQPKVTPEVAASTRDTAHVEEPKYRTVPYSSLLPPLKPMRFAMDEEKMRELCDSIRAIGLIHPIAVYPEGEKWRVGAGHRRYVALGMIGAVSADIHIFKNREELEHAIMLHENTMREDVTAAEEGQQFLELANEHGWGIEQLCKFFHRSETYINERAILVSEFADVSERVASRELAWGQAKAIMRCKEPQRRAYLIDQAVTHGVNARNIGVMVDDFKRQDRIASTLGNPAQPGEVYIMPDVQVPVCIWCQRSDDQGNMTLVSVHSYHKRDLEELLDHVGNMPRAAASGESRG